MLDLITILREYFPNLSIEQIKHRIIKASKSHIFKKIQLLQKFGATQSEVNEHIMGLLVTYMQLPSDAPPLKE